MTGQVQWFEPKKGYGFILPQEYKTPIYFHHSEFKEPIEPFPGDLLDFEISPGEKGPKATKIKKTN